MTQVLVPAERIVRWFENFEARHGATELTVLGGGLSGLADDGSTFTMRLPFGRAYEGNPDLAAFEAAIAPPADWGVLLVRKGGFAVARLRAGQAVESHVGRRHVQGRTKAGGQSQQRFARRRDGQARQAYQAAAEHAARIFAGLTGPLVTGGDRAAIDEVLSDVRLCRMAVVGPWLPVPDPRRAVLEQAIADARSAWIEVENR